MFNQRVGKVICIFLLISAIYCGSASALIKFPPEKAILPNGMRVIVVEDRSLPTVSAGLMFNTSIISHKNNCSGLSQIIRKLFSISNLDKQTRFEYNSRIEKHGITQSFGAKLHALHNGCQGDASALKNILTAIRDTSFFLKPTKDDFTKAKEKVRRNVESELLFPLEEGYLQGKAWRDLFGSNAGGFGGTISEEQLSDFTFERFAKASKSVLSPNNSVLVIVGDINTSDVFRMCMDVFGTLTANVAEVNAAVKNRTCFGSLKKINKEYLKIDKIETVIAFPAPAFSDSTMPAVHLWQSALSEINDAWLPHKFGKEFPELSNLSAEYIPGKKNGMFVIQFSSSGSDVDRPISVLLSSLGNLFLAPPKGRELNRLVNIKLLMELQNREVKNNRVFNLGYSELMKTFKISNGMPAFWKRITRDDMTDVAKKIFDGSEYVIRIAYPMKLQKKEMTPTILKTLDNGMKVLVHNYTGSEVIGVSVRIGLDACQENKAQAVKSRLVSDMFSQMVNENNNGKMRIKLDHIGSKLSAVRIDDALYLLGITTKRNLKPLVKLIRKMLSASISSIRNFKLAKEKLRRSTEKHKADEFRVMMNKLNDELFPGIINDLSTLDVKHISALKKKDIELFLQKWVIPANMQCVVVGNINSDDINPLLENEFGMLERKEMPSVSACPAWVDTPLKENLEREVKLPGKSSNGIVGFAYRMKKIIGIEDKNALLEHFGANSVITHLLFAGKNSMISSALKKEGVEFGSINGRYLSSKSYSVFYFFVSVPKDKVDQTKDIIKAQLALISDMKVSEEDIRTAGKWLGSVFNTVLERSNSQALIMSSFIGHGLKYDYLPELLNIYRSVTVKDVVKACKNNFGAYLLLIGRPN